MDRVSGQNRIHLLDSLRGFAILAILFMNIPYLASYATLNGEIEPRLVSWTPLDQVAWGFTWSIDGTMRGLLQLLFGAGMMIMLRHGLGHEDQRRADRIFLRRNLLLIAFGLFNVFVLMWAGDILLPYGFAALLIFPLRRVGARSKFALGAAVLLLLASHGIADYLRRETLIASVHAVEAKQAARTPLTAADNATLVEWQKVTDEFAVPLQGERAKLAAIEYGPRHSGGLAGWWRDAVRAWWDDFFGHGWIGFAILESAATMLIGAAFYQWGIIQGRRSTRFYAALLAACYGFGLGIRAIAYLDYLRFSPEPDVVRYVVEPITREFIAVGHVALFALLMRAAPALIRPLEAPGRWPLTVYFTASIACFLVFSSAGLGLFARVSPAEWVGIAGLIIATQITAINLLARRYLTGPFEWLWKTLAYGTRQPLRRPLPAPGPIPAAA